MKIYKKTNNITFGSTPLHRVNILNAVDGQLIPAVFSRLNPRDKTDQIAIKEIQNFWKGADKFIMDIFTNGFDKDAIKTQKYNAIELIGDESLSKKIIGLINFFSKEDSISLSSTPKELCLNALIVKPEFAHKSTGRGIKNIGEVLFGEIFKQSKKAKADYLNFLSEDDEFYFRTLGKAGINARDNKEIFYPNNHEFTLDKKYFDKYLDYWKNKFKINVSF